MKSFKQLELSPTLMKAVERLGFSEPTKIQAESIPLILKGKDIVGESATGSGKTFAFGSGIIENCKPIKKIQAIVLTPTRELAEQVKNAISEFSQGKFTITAVYGGVSFNPQAKALERTDVVVATPGRLLDHVRQGTIDLSHVSMLVLDEADRMLDMGFIDDVEIIIKQCPKKRQTLFFSATMPSRIQALADKHMNNPEYITATKEVDPTKLTQVYYDVDAGMKFSLLVHLLKDEKEGLVMIFCNTRRMTDTVARSLKATKIRAIAIHGGLTQNRRLKILETFNDGKVTVLVCTDVAARGLHIDDVSHVYNYDLPNDPKEYVHRIGRTARAGEHGQVINLLAPRDHDNFGRILRENGFDIQNVERPYVERVQLKREENDRGRGGSRGGNRQGGRGQSRGPSRGRSGPGGSRGGRSSGGSRGNSSGNRSGGSRGNNSRSRSNSSSHQGRSRNRR